MGPRLTFDARWPWMRTCGSHTSIWVFFSPRRTILAKRPPFSRGDPHRPSKPDAHYRLGRLWSSLGREHDAQDEFDKVQKLAAEEPAPPLLQIPGGGSVNLSPKLAASVCAMATAVACAIVSGQTRAIADSLHLPAHRIPPG